MSGIYSDLKVNFKYLKMKRRFLVPMLKETKTAEEALRLKNNIYLTFFNTNKERYSWAGKDFQNTCDPYIYNRDI